MRISGKVYVFGDDIDTDQIVPGRYLELVKHEEIAQHAMEGADPTFVTRFEPGSLVVGGRNFGCGSSREHAPIALKTIGVACVVAESFGRIFYRNCINIGLPVFRCPGIRAAVKEGDVITVDLVAGKIILQDGREISGEALVPEVIDMIQSGGLIEFVRRQFVNSPIAATNSKEG